MIVGAPKAGTTSLHSYLGQHPGIRAHPQREFAFFTDEAAYARGYQHAWQLYFADARPDQALAGKYVAMMYSMTAMRRLKLHNPDVQVVLVLRDPVARAYSEYWYARRRGRERADTFEIAVRRCLDATDEDPLQRNAYLARGQYMQYLERIYDLFSPTQVNVLLLEQIAQDPVASCQSLFRKIDNLDAGFAPCADRRENTAAEARSGFLLSLMSDRRRFGRLRRGLRALVNERTKQRIKSALQRLNDRPFTPPAMNEPTRRQLVEYFSPWNRRLAETLGVSLERWTSSR